MFSCFGYISRQDRPWNNAIASLAVKVDKHRGQTPTIQGWERVVYQRFLEIRRPEEFERNAIENELGNVTTVKQAKLGSPNMSVLVGKSSHCFQK